MFKSIEILKNEILALSIPGNNLNNFFSSWEEFLELMASFNCAWSDFVNSWECPIYESNDFNLLRGKRLKVVQKLKCFLVRYIFVKTFNVHTICRWPWFHVWANIFASINISITLFSRKLTLSWRWMVNFRLSTFTLQ